MPKVQFQLQIHDFIGFSDTKTLQFIILKDSNLQLWRMITVAIVLFFVVTIARLTVEILCSRYRIIHQESILARM